MTNRSRLSEALDYWTTPRDQQWLMEAHVPESLEPIFDAARRVLEPDLDAAMLQLGAIARLTDAPTDWLRAEARAIIDAALHLDE